MKKVININEQRLKKAREKIADELLEGLTIINECVECRDGKDYCPVKKWYMKGGCPFINRRECDVYAEMCGKR